MVCHNFLFLKSLHFVFLLMKVKYWLNNDNNEKKLLFESQYFPPQHFYSTTILTDLFFFSLEMHSWLTDSANVPFICVQMYFATARYGKVA